MSQTRGRVLGALVQVDMVEADSNHELISLAHSFIPYLLLGDPLLVFKIEALMQVSI